MEYEEMTLFGQGWYDCRAYRGYSREDPEYHRGFDSCLTAYYNAIKIRRGWNIVSAVGVDPDNE